MALLMQGTSHSMCEEGGLEMDWGQTRGQTEQPSSPSTPPCPLPGLGGQQTSAWSALMQAGNKATGVAGQCHLCQGASLRPATEACQFCEHRVCGTCVRQCLNCGGNFCHLCSTLNYDTVEERVFCLGCAG